MRKFPDLLMVVLILGSCLVFSYSAITGSVKYPVKSVKPNFSFLPAGDSLFKSGDIIFRDGRGIISSAFRKLSLRDPRYSHAGIIHREGHRLFVYHLIGGEGNKDNSMRKDDITDFCSTLQANSFAIYRTDQDGSTIDSLAGNYFEQHLQFDTRFDLSTNDKMYCTELVYKILKQVSAQDNFLSLTTLSGVKYVSCDDIYLSSHSKKIYSQEYSSNSSK
jgi:hypothetical protein